MHRFRILVPVSFGIQSDIALKQAKILAQQANAMISCLHIIEKPGLISGKLVSRGMEKKARLECEVKLATKVERILSGDSSVSYELIVSSGKVYWKILEKASELEIDLILMGRSDVSGSSTHLLGSNTAAVLERSEIPVLTVRNKEPHSFRHVFIPLDFSASFGIPLTKAIGMAEKLKAIVTVCIILHPGDSRLKDAYRSRLIRIKKLFTNSGIFCRAKLVITEKRAVDVILSNMDQYHPDILILMRQAESEFKRISVGSLAKELIVRSDFPVLTIAPDAYEEDSSLSALLEDMDHPIGQHDPNDSLIPTD